MWTVSKRLKFSFLRTLNIWIVTLLPETSPGHLRLRRASVSCRMSIVGTSIATESRIGSIAQFSSICVVTVLNNWVFSIIEGVDYFGFRFSLITHIQISIWVWNDYTLLTYTCLSGCRRDRVPTSWPTIQLRLTATDYSASALSDCIRSSWMLTLVRLMTTVCSTSDLSCSLLCLGSQDCLLCVSSH